MSNQHLTDEDRMFADNWEKCGDAIHAVVERERALGPFAIAATRERVRPDAGSGPWIPHRYEEDEDAVGQAASTGVLSRVRVGSPMKSRTIVSEVDCSRDAGVLISAIEELTRGLIAVERAELAALMAPTDVRPWGTGPLPISDLRDGDDPADFDLIINTDEPGGEQLAGLRQKLADFLGGKVIAGSLGEGAHHLLVSSKAITIYEAGPVQYARPTAGQFEIETVLALTVDRDATLVALAANP